MHPFTKGWWRFAWSNWGDRTPSCTTVEYRTRDHFRLVAKYHRVVFGLWFATTWDLGKKT